MANLEYRGHLISVFVIYDTQNHYQLTPIIDIRRSEFIEVLNTILTQQAFNYRRKRNRVWLWTRARMG